MEITPEKAATALKMMHGSCPKRMDINAPDMELFEVMRIRLGTLDGYRCQLCHTIVYVLCPLPPPRPDAVLNDYDPR
jgi:hypothetical protein